MTPTLDELRERYEALYSVYLDLKATHEQIRNIWLKWEERAIAAEARVAELESQLKDSGASLSSR